MFFMVLVFLGLGAGQPPALSLPEDWHASFAALEGTSWYLKSKPGGYPERTP